jgi:hypothetical protein
MCSTTARNTSTTKIARPKCNCCKPSTSPNMAATRGSPNSYLCGSTRIKRISIQSHLHP